MKYPKELTYKELVLTYLKIGANAYGGWSTTYLLLEKEFAQNRNLLSKDQLQTAVASGQALPGPAQVIVAAQTSYFLKGVKGSVLATFFYLLPSFVLTFTFCFIYFKYLAENNNADYTIGIQAAVGGIIIGNAYKIAKTNATTPLLWVAAVLSALLYSVLKVPTFLIIAMFGAAGIILNVFRSRKNRV
jgi:chromate transporter